MSLIGSTNEEKIWNYLKAKGLPDCGIAGLMGNLYAESCLVPTNLQNSYEKALSFTDAAYTAAVDNGTYQNFVKDSAGYGLAQWTYWSRKKNLLDFAKKKGKSIGDLEMQLDFLWNELQGYTVVISTLKTAKTVRAASDSVLLNFERPADQSEAAAMSKRRPTASSTVRPPTPVVRTGQSTPETSTRSTRSGTTARRTATNGAICSWTGAL